MTIQERYRKAIGIVRAIEGAVFQGASLTTDQLLDFADQIVALTGRQRPRAEPKPKTKTKVSKANGPEKAGERSAFGAESLADA